LNKVLDITGTYKIVGALGFKKCADLFGKKFKRHDNSSTRQNFSNRYVIVIYLMTF
jgi:hypothetical protein